MTSQKLTPVRSLFQLLKEHSGQDLQYDLEQIDEYREIKGDPEPRFCEWAYRSLQARRLVEDILGTLLRPSDIKKIATQLKMSKEDTQLLSPDALLREVLRKIGIQEPAFPKPSL